VLLRGKASDLPMLWKYYHVADQQGRQMALTFILEDKYAERFGDADREIVDSLRFVDGE
jgi:hypothetical protein